MFLCILLFAAAVQARLGRLARVVGRDASLRESYDFVVAGGGTSGLTVADRLTEDPDGEQNRLLAGRVLTCSAASLRAGDRIRTAGPA